MKRCGSMRAQGKSYEKSYTGKSTLKNPNI